MNKIISIGCALAIAQGAWATDVDCELEAARVRGITVDVKIGDDSKGYIPGGASVFEMDVTIVSLTGGGTLFHSQEGVYDPIKIRALSYTAEGCWKYEYHKKAAILSEPGSVVAGRRYKLTAKPEGLWVDGEQVLSCEPAEFSVGKRLWLFKRADVIMSGLKQNLRVGTVPVRDATESDAL